MVFGFGKALDVLLDGDMVRRHEWPPEMALSLVPARLSEPPVYLKQREFDFVLERPELMLVEYPQDGAIRAAWHPRTDDLLAEDWEYVQP